MPIETVEPRRLYRQVADQLRNLIDAGEFPVGSRLPTERELAAQLGISRPTVREALIALEVDGRVRIRVGSGIYVLPPPPPSQTEPNLPMAGPFDILEARALIEGAICEVAAQTASAEHIAAIDATLTAMRRGAESGSDMMELDRAFHVAIARITGNDALVNVVGDLFDQRIHPYFAQLAGYFENATTWRQAQGEHAAVRDAIAGHDPKAARQAMETHLRNSQQRFSESFGNGSHGSAPLEPRLAAEAVRRPRIRRIASR